MDADDINARIERVSYQSSVARIRAGDWEEVVIDEEVAYAALCLLEDRAASGDEWVLSRIGHTRARLRGIRRALDEFRDSVFGGGDE